MPLDVEGWPRRQGRRRSSSELDNDPVRRELVFTPACFTGAWKARPAQRRVRRVATYHLPTAVNQHQNLFAYILSPFLSYSRKGELGVVIMADNVDGMEDLVVRVFSCFVPSIESSIPI